jgi:hypothetical protein
LVDIEGGGLGSKARAARRKKKKGKKEKRDGDY